MKYEREALDECTGKGQLKFSEKNVSQCHFVRHKLHMDWPGISRWDGQTVPPHNAFFFML